MARADAALLPGLPARRHPRGLARDLLVQREAPVPGRAADPRERLHPVVGERTGR